MKFSMQPKNIFYLVVIAVSLVAIIVLGVGYSKSREAASDISFEGGSTVTIEKKEDKVLISINTQTIQEGLENMGFLVTQEYYFTQIEKYTKEKELFLGIPSSSEFMYSYDGSVFAGVDFTKITVEKDDSAKKLIVKLPESEIQTVSVDKDTLKIYSEKDSLWNPLKLEDYNLSLSEFEKTAKQKALDSGILDRSDEQAKALISNFISSMPSASGYAVTFE
ncbi:DUF4230 domain-containing protein [Butyrivibrio sp. WCD3002]|uniref:DUF4230 domain-containing protein n=1 Tax=Butyrivibrio sp. WCD3002 TaxID=1280676 RepID=UPI00041C5FE1|nr:DUF4230 domain-containing protein [Butyrivibrio sp. WCD3002]